MAPDVAHTTPAAAPLDAREAVAFYFDPHPDKMTFQWDRSRRAVDRMLRFDRGTLRASDVADCA